jgi:hypothetical protein
MRGANRDERMAGKVHPQSEENRRNELEYERWQEEHGGLCEQDYGDSFSGQLRGLLSPHYREFFLHGFPLQKIAYLSGTKVQSLSRFNRAQGDQRPGLETPTIELLWAYLNLGIKRGDTSFNSPGFAGQLRSAIRTCGLRPAEISRATGISASVLSRFLSEWRKGLSFGAIEKIWELLDLKIIDAGSPAGQEGPVDGDDDMPF